ncbi:MAG: DUF1049 domain-containing protein [Candidatus Aureabacteria bacterium]|nr:DUF1049 domain-containing protein [Candidatus Auribacterota bacterium]
MKYKLITGFILVCLVILFIVQNNAVVNVYFFSWTVSTSGAFLFISIFALGGIFGWILHSYLTVKPKPELDKQK